MDKYTVTCQNLKYNLNSFPGVGNMNSATEEKFLERLQERLNMMKKRAFFNPKTLNGMREDSVYALNIDEFWHHTKPYVHKIFVIYLTNLDSGDQELVYAKSCSPKRVDSQEYLTNSMETAYSIVAMLKGVPENVRQNLVAIVSDRCRMNISAMSIVNYLCPFKPPQLVHDVTHLQSKFCKENDMFCSHKVELIVETNFKKETYVQQLSTLREECGSKN
ncbi:uncharacterized protein LOC111519512 [Drosophila willistoni]|uniref:uncharacterized protein LOC111519512 n=1 Tax=Drosophila willistoni TaxID=7260 RepID=UPI001F0845F7|nr:uncharacterized protein LOC111519512 [Drosophila willistoni]